MLLRWTSYTKYSKPENPLVRIYIIKLIQWQSLLLWKISEVIFGSRQNIMYKLYFHVSFWIYTIEATYNTRVISLCADSPRRPSTAQTSPSLYENAWAAIYFILLELFSFTIYEYLPVTLCEIYHDVAGCLCQSTVYYHSSCLHRHSLMWGSGSNVWDMHGPPQETWSLTRGYVRCIYLILFQAQV